MPRIGERVEVTIEVPRGGFVKRDQQGRIDLVSPLPCPFNYGSIGGTASDDGEPLDALVLGPRRGRGERVAVEVRAIVRFVDLGLNDDKLVGSARPLTPSERQLIVGFFRLYAVAKGVFAPERTAFVRLDE